MDLTASGVRTTSAVKPARTGLLPANVVLGGSLLSLIGLTWDIQWHDDVGPDTFFTLPHLFLYAGSAVVGLASLAVVLLTTAARRAGRPVDPRIGGRVVNVFGRTFAAPLGYLVSGVGAATFLLYGLWDQWWHGLYGFDAVIDSPPHIGLLLAITVSLIGTTAVFAAAREHRWGRLGTLASLTVLLTFGPVLALGLQQVPDDYADAVAIGTSMMAVLLVSVGAGFARRPGGAAGTAAMVAVVQGVFWWFSPWAAKAYADLVGLPLRDAVSGVPAMPSLAPLALLPVAALMELVFFAGRRRGWRAGRVSVVAGGLAGLLIGLSLPVQRTLLYTGAHLPPVWYLTTTAVLSGLLGLLGGFAGWRFGGMLCLLAPAKRGETADA
ncbi:hypothetical protein [Amycolatopsis vancoresmycina]|uniref:Uncharacterized protein n=1 Tax=Amycolatopsis vancoresmycina DSM 44592 TaxID=1292037 RepID=R1HZJ6_9PSEU|nr:hypothetical protein [Amycolatopsis vancoresmycina]EOD65731.1 hypothetical protein H480_25267 [Amycolatopsis vancoresmycina DSM 44592]